MKENKDIDVTDINSTDDSDIPDTTSSHGNPVLFSDYEHKAFLVNPNFEKIRKIQDFLVKELSLSRIDNELATIYANKLDCIEEWFNLGFHNLAMRRFTNLLARLQINKSVGGFERALQTANVNAGVSLGEEASLQPFGAEEEEGSGIDLVNMLSSARKSLKRHNRRRLSEF